jgi:hypothetical protein
MKKAKFLLFLLATTFMLTNASVAYENSQEKKTKNHIHIATSFSQLQANGGADFFGITAGKWLRPKIGIQLGLYQSLSGSETARQIDHVETFVQRASRTLRFGINGIYKALSSHSFQLNATTGAALWHNQISSTVEDTPMGDFYNFDPMKLTSFGLQAGFQGLVDMAKIASFSFAVNYIYFPESRYSVDYDMMGMKSTQNYVLDWSGMNYELGFLIKF